MTVGTTTASIDSAAWTGTDATPGIRVDERERHGSRARTASRSGTRAIGQVGEPMDQARLGSKSRSPAAGRAVGLSVDLRSLSTWASNWTTTMTRRSLHSHLDHSRRLFRPHVCCWYPGSVSLWARSPWPVGRRLRSRRALVGPIGSESAGSVPDLGTGRVPSMRADRRTLSLRGPGRAASSGRSRRAAG